MKRPPRAAAAATARTPKRRKDAPPPSSPPSSSRLRRRVGSGPAPPRPAPPPTSPLSPPKRRRKKDDGSVVATSTTTTRREEEGERRKTMTAAKTSVRNPFLSAASRRRDDDDDEGATAAEQRGLRPTTRAQTGSDEVLRRAVEFSEATSSSIDGGFEGGGKRKVSRDGGDDDGGGGTNEKLVGAASALLSYLKPNAAPPSRVDGGAGMASRSRGGDDRGGDDGEELLSKTDVARLLLPWAVGGLPSDDGDDDAPRGLRWRTLVACVEVLLSDGGTKGGGGGADFGVGTTTTATAAEAFSSVLTQSALNRLVPLAARVALSSLLPPSSDGSSGGSVDDEARDAASRCYVLLTSSLTYRPTMDAVCGELLPLVDGLVRDAAAASEAARRRDRAPRDREADFDDGDVLLDDPRVVRLPRSRQSDVAIATFRLVRTLQRRSAANPKKVFGLLSSTASLAAAGRLRFVRRVRIPPDRSSSSSCAIAGDDDAPSSASGSGGAVVGNDGGVAMKETEEAAEIEAAVRDVLRSGLFDPGSHLDGFRTMDLPVPTIDGIKDIDEAAVAGRSHKTKLVASEKPGDDGSKEKKRKRGKKRRREDDGGNGAGDGSTTAASTAMKRARSRYQFDLLSSLERMASSDSDDDVAAYASVLPLLLGVYFVESTSDEEDRRHDAGGTGGSHRGHRAADPDALTKAQFRFWSHAILPAVDRMCRNGGGDRGSLALRVAASECLELLSRHGAYLPSHDRPEHYAFLDGLTERLLRLAEGNRGKSDRDDDEEEDNMEEVDDDDVEARAATSDLESLRRLLELDHRLLHGRLDRLVAVAARSLPDRGARRHRRARRPSAAASASASAGRRLLLDVVDAYRKLRQVGHLLRSMLPVAAAPEEGPPAKEEEESLLPVQERILRDGPVARALSSSIRSCPPGQVEELWGIFDGQIADGAGRSSTEDEDDDDISSSSPLSSISFVVDLFALFLRSVRVDKRSAPIVASLCERSTETSVRRLAGDGGDGDGGGGKDGANVRSGLRLCGRLVDLHTRCQFWRNDAATADAVATASLLSRRDGGGDSGSSVLSVLLAAARSATAGPDGDVGHREAAASASSSARPPPPDRLAGELQRLACHRIRQLHSSIYRRRQAELNGVVAAAAAPGDPATTDPTGADQETEADGAGGSGAMVEEARLLVRFSVDVARRRPRGRLDDDDDDGPSWVPLAQTVATWAPYADPRDVDSFLAWLFSALAAKPDKDAAAESGGWTTDPPARTDSFVVPAEELDRERDVATMLLRDASFYEVPELSGRIRAVAVGLVSDLVRSALGGEEDVAVVGGGSVDLAPVVEAHADHVEASNPSPERSSDVREDIGDDEAGRADRLERATRILMAVNGMPDVRSEDPRASSEALDSLLRIDASLRLSLRGANGNGTSGARVTAIRAMCACRGALVRELADARGGGRWNVISDEAALVGFVRNLFSSQVGALRDDFAVGSDIESLVCLSTGEVAQEVLTQCVRVFDRDSKPLKAFADVLSETMGSKLPEVRPELSVRLKANFARSAIRRTILLDADECHMLGKKNADCGSKARDVCFKATCDVYAKMNVASVGAVANAAVPEPKRGRNPCPETLLLLADLVRFWDAYGAKTTKGRGHITDPGIASAIDAALKATTTSLLRGQGAGASRQTFQSAPFYFLASVSSRELESDALEGLSKAFSRHFVARGGRTDPLFDAAISAFVARTDGRRLQALLAFVFDELKSTGPATTNVEVASAVYFFYLVLLVTKGQSQRSILSGHARTFLDLALDLLKPSQGSERSTWDVAPKGASLIISLIGKRDLISLNGRNIARILAHVNSLLGPIRTAPQKESTKVPVPAYKSCCAIVSSLLKHYPKQLYGCSPSLISAMHSLMCHAIRCEPHAEHHGGLERAQSFARICELLSPHGDIFKKHVVGMLLEYIDSLDEGVSPAVKKNMLPAVYALLDMCSTFEMQQLNTMMRNTSKAIFRSVYRNYQKVHQYKGQY